MKSSFRVWRMLSSSRSDLIGQVFMALGIAVATLIVVLCVGANIGLENRDARTAWRNPTFDHNFGSDSLPKTESLTGGGLLVTVLDQRGGEPIMRSTYAAVGPNAPVPPGLGRLPEPGEVWVSPALLARASANPEVLSDFTNPTGLIGDDGLGHRNELGAIIGAEPDDVVFTQQPSVPIWRLNETYGPAVVTDWATKSNGSDLQLYRILTALGSVILIVPALSMIGGAARMLTGRRSVELARLRLVGATGRQITLLTILDTARASAIGASAGLALSLLGLRFFESIEVGGGSWIAGDLMPNPAVFVVIWLGVIAISFGSAVLTLRRVNTSPLGVATNDQARGATWLRALGLVGAMFFFYATVNSRDASQLMILLAWTAVLSSTMVVGPLLVRLIASVWLFVAKRPVSLLAARRLLDDPKTAYRQVGGLALATLIAGLLAAVSGPVFAGTAADEAGQVDFAVPVDISTDELAQLTTALEPLTKDITVQDEMLDYPATFVVVPSDGVTTEEIRSTVTEVVPESLVASFSEQTQRLQQLIDDFQQASLLMIAVAGIAAAVGVAAHLTTSIIDQRRPLTALRLTGVPFRSLAAARRRAILLPLIAATGSAGMLGIWVGLIFSRSSIGIRPFVLVFVTVLAAIGLTLAAELVSRPMLKRYTTDRSVLES